MQRPDVNRAKFLYDYFRANMPPSVNIDIYIQDSIRDIKYYSEQLAAARQHLAFRKELVKQIPLSAAGLQKLSDAHIITFQDVLDKKDKLIELYKDDLLSLKKHVENKFINTYRVKLSLDDKNLHYTLLLVSIVKYVRLNKLKSKGIESIGYNSNSINRLCDYLSPALGWFDWIISNKNEKSSACQAFDKLEEIYKQYELCNQIKELIESKLNVESSYGWDVFKKFPTDVWNVIEEINPGVISPDPDKINLIDTNSILKAKAKTIKNTGKTGNENIDDYIVDIFEMLYINQQGLTANQIAQRLNVDKNIVQEILNKNKHIFVKIDGNHWILKTKNKSTNTECQSNDIMEAEENLTPIEQKYVKSSNAPKQTHSLKHRIMNVLQRVPSGMTAKEIAFELDCDKSTVNSMLYQHPKLFVKVNDNKWTRKNDKPRCNKELISVVLPQNKKIKST